MHARAVPRLDAFAGYERCDAMRIGRHAVFSESNSTYWKGQSCNQGRADGYGYLLVCKGQIDCRSYPQGVSMQAVTVADRGNLSVCPVVIQDAEERFSGKLTETGTYLLGKLTRTRHVEGSYHTVETFTGKFHPGNHYSVGALNFRNRTYLTRSFDLTNVPAGETIVIERDGSSYLADCRGFSCTQIDKPIRLNERETQLFEKYFFQGVACGIEKKAVETLLRSAFRGGWQLTLAEILASIVVSETC
jgi:hypothetical protein